jgi:hypothetical protein
MVHDTFSLPRFQVQKTLFAKFSVTSAAVLLTLGVSLGVAFTNCSPIKFAESNEALKTKLGDGGVIINDGAPFTKDVNVSLRLMGEHADEMTVSNTADCSTPAQWEPFTSEKPWVLGVENTQAQVSARFRSSENREVESECFVAQIIHDNQPPMIVIQKEAPKYTNAPNADIHFIASDELSGVKASKCMNVTTGAAIACSESILEALPTEGAYEFSIAAEDGAGNVSKPVRQSLVVDRTKPTVLLNATPSIVTGAQDSAFTFSGTDAGSPIAGFECRVDGSGNFTSCKTPYNVNLPAGTHKFEVRSIDSALNVSDIVSYNWTIDLSAPIITITKAPPAFDNTVSPQIAFTGTDDGKAITKFDCSLDKAAYVACTSPTTLSNLKDGSHTYSVRGYDTAGNVSVPKTASWTVDTAVPTVKLTSFPNKVTNDPVAAFGFAAADASGIAKLECKLDSGAFEVCTSPKSYAALKDGAHSFQVRATDNAGNAALGDVYSWTVDTVAPTLTLATTTLAITREAGATFSITVKDTGKIAQVLCNLDSQKAFSPCTSATSAVYTNLANGKHSLVAQAVDEAGNSSSLALPSAKFDWTIDRGAPVIAYSVKPESLYGIDAPVTFAFTVTDSPAGVKSVVCTLNDVAEACTAKTEKRLTGLAAKSYVFKVVATDNVGNVSTDVQNFRVSNALVSQIQDVNVSLSKKVDILMVIDNSGSMAKEQLNMAERFKTFIDQLNGLDWQIAIVTTDVSTTKPLFIRQGRLVPMVGAPAANAYVLNSKMDPALVRTVFGNTIQRPVWEVKGGTDPEGVEWEAASGAERGIAASVQAINRAFDDSQPENLKNKDFFRADSALAILVITDAKETGNDKTDTPDYLIDLVQKSWNGTRPFAFHSIVVPTQYTRLGDAVYDKSDPCKGKREDEAQDGTVYINLSKKTGGIVGDVCADDYGSQLTNMGKGTAELIRSVTLKCKPADLNKDGIANDIDVATANGSPVGGFKIDGLKVTFDTALPPGLNKLRYSCYE